MAAPAIVKETEAVLVYIRRIAELQRRLDTLQSASPALPSAPPSTPAPNPLLFRQSQHTIASLTASNTALEALLQASQEQATASATELKRQHEEVFRLAAQLRTKESQITGLLESLARLERQVMGQSTYPVGLEEEVRRAISTNEELQRDLYTTQAKTAALQLRVAELEEELKWPHAKQLSVRRTEPISVLPSVPHCSLDNSKAALTGVQLDFTQLHRKYICLRNKTGIEETLASALGRIQELQAKLAQARHLVFQLRLDVEQVLGWRVELCGESLFLTMKASGLSVELIRAEEYRAVPGVLLTKGLETQACGYLTQARSWPGFLACTLLTCIDNSLQAGD